MVQLEDNLGKEDERIEFLEFKTNAAVLPENRGCWPWWQRAQGLEPDYLGLTPGFNLLGVFSWGKTSLYLGSIFCKVGLIIPPTLLDGCEDSMVYINYLGAFKLKRKALSMITIIAKHIQFNLNISWWEYWDIDRLMACNHPKVTKAPKYKSRPFDS